MNVNDVLNNLERRGTKATRDGMARYGIVVPKAFGVMVGAFRTIAKEIGKDHALALSLWDTGWYEARLLASFIADPDKMTPAQMDRWTRDFDNCAVTSQPVPLEHAERHRPYHQLDFLAEMPVLA